MLDEGGMKMTEKTNEGRWNKKDQKKKEESGIGTTDKRMEKIIISDS